ncbi:hypothetical protein ACLK1T_09260 [Escherichia coli]
MRSWQNGGDGYVVARLAKAVGIEVTLLAQESEKRCRKRPRWHAKHG